MRTFACVWRILLVVGWALVVSGQIAVSQPADASLRVSVPGGGGPELPATAVGSVRNTVPSSPQWIYVVQSTVKIGAQPEKQDDESATSLSTFFKQDMHDSHVSDDEFRVYTPDQPEFGGKKNKCRSNRMCELVKLVEHFTDSSEFTSVDLTFEWGSGDSTGNYWPKTNQCGDGPTDRCREIYRHQLAKKWVAALVAI